MRNISRKEKKFLVDLTSAKKLEGLLSQVMPGDPHNGSRGYPVRSLYFDTLHDRDFAEKRRTSRCWSSSRSRERTSGSARCP